MGELQLLLREENVVTIFSESTQCNIEVFNEDGKIEFTLLTKKFNAMVVGAKNTLRKYIPGLNLEPRISEKDKKEIEDAITSENGSKLTNVVNRIVGKAVNEFKNLCKVEKKNLFASLVLLYAIILCNSIVVLIATMSFGTVGVLAAACIVCPFMEELFRSISVKNGIGNEFNLLLNVYEMITYVRQLVGMGVKKGMAIAFRLLPVIMHTFNTALQKRGYEKGKLDKTRGITTVIHITWNTLSTVFNNKIVNFLLRDILDEL